MLFNPEDVPPSFIPQRIVIFVGAAGLSFCGIVTYFSLRKHLRQAQIKDEEKDRKHLEELSSLRSSLSDSRVEIAATKKALKERTEEIQRLKKCLAETERDRDGMEKQNRILADQTRNLGALNQKLEGELDFTKAEQRDTIELLRIRTAELKGSQSFLTKADILSGAEVIKLVEALNGEIMQTAAVMAEAFIIEEKRLEAKNGESEEMGKVYARASEIVGHRMAEMLRMSQHHEDPILVQMGLQTAMVGYSHWVISSWCYESPEDERMLGEVYARVRETEEQAVSGRWRQLTRTHFQRMVAAPNFDNDMAEVLANIFIAAGFKESLTALQLQIVTIFGERIHLVMQCAQHLNKTIGEGVTSCDLEPIYVESEIPFDGHTMDDSLSTPDPSTPIDEKVLCTTDMGLGRAEKISGASGEWHEVTLLKPKVILPSRLLELIDTVIPQDGAL